MWCRQGSLASSLASSLARRASHSSRSTSSASRPPEDGKTLADFLPGGSEFHGATSAASCAPISKAAVRKPPWLKMYNPNSTAEGGERYKEVKATVQSSGLATVCQEARCPNIGECWSKGTATVMIMGDTCTRGCHFCAVATSRQPPPLEADEPVKIAEAVVSWKVNYIVLTMVDRDDLSDQGAAHVAATVRELKQRKGSELRVETLIGDFQGQLHLVEQVIDSGMDVLAHNLETVERLQRTVRDRRANYAQSLSVLRHAKSVKPGLVTKSSLMLGLGEASEEIHQTLKDLRDNGVDIVTFGQYLQPTKHHMKVEKYVTPEEFDEWRKAGEALGLHVASGPMVRSSYRAGELFEDRLARRAALENLGEIAPLELHFRPSSTVSTQ